MNLANFSVRTTHVFTDPAPTFSHLFQGIPLHPSFQTLVTILDKFSLGLPNHSSSIIMSPPHVVPCSKYSAANYSPYLPRHLLSLVPRVPEPACDTDHTSDRTIKLKRAPQDDSSHGKDPPNTHDITTFSGVPSPNGGMNVRRWGWPGYLTFGRGSSKNSTLEYSKKLAFPDEKPNTGPQARTETVEVDKTALEDAISENISLAASNISGELAEESKNATHPSAQLDDVQPPVGTQDEEGKTTPIISDMQINHVLVSSDVVSPTPSTSSSAVSLDASPPETSGPEFSCTTVYLADPENSLETRRRRVYYAIVSVFLLTSLIISQFCAR